jgi:hypothetical protein
MRCYFGVCLDLNVQNTLALAQDFKTNKLIYSAVLCEKRMVL